MCSTHNPKKNYFATREKVCIRFTFVNEDSLHRSFMIDVAQFEESDCLSLSKAILYLGTKGFNVDKYRIYLPQFENITVDFESGTLLPFERLPKKELFLHLKDATSPQKTTEQHKVTKQPERMIGEVIEKVKIWRYLFESRGVTLKEAAISVGVAKKSLDDYFLLLRQAEILGFNFMENLETKMGELRHFIKKNSKKLPGGKLPLELNNLKCYNLVPDCSDAVLNDSKSTETKSNCFQFNEMDECLKAGSMDLDSNCDYACCDSDSD